MKAIAARQPDFERDGWCLDDGEQINREAPETFSIPDLALRQNLHVGDYAKLIFRTAVEGDEISVERMWGAVRERIPGGYIGILDNEAGCHIGKREFWLGAELPFEYRHIIAVADATDESKALAIAPAAIPWDRG